LLRISLVHYLNAAPLGWSLLHGPLKGRFQVVPSSPSKCADDLACGEADVGLIPSIEYQRIPDLKIVPGVAIGASRRVRSVLLVRNRDGQDARIRKVALDTNSRTSAALAKLLLTRIQGPAPEFVHHEPDAPAMLRTCDAALIIGDAALKLDLRLFRVTDLAQAWIEWQKQPFVFAVWACRSDAHLPTDFTALLREAKEWGCAQRSWIAEAYAARLSLPTRFLEEYLCRNVVYEMGEGQIAGLERFYRLAHEANLTPCVRPLEFLQDSARQSWNEV
jgi:chorismate dehydratase